MKIFTNIFEKIISVENLFIAWDAFKKDKRKKRDVLQFEWDLEENIFRLHRDLRTHTYKHGAYTSFYITDPKRRHIHKAAVRDRVLHHAIFSVLNPIFEPTFIPHSFSCRIGKGTHRGVQTLEDALQKVSRNGMKPCFVLKYDIRRFFDSVDHKILLDILGRKIKDDDATCLLQEVIGSFVSEDAGPNRPRGLPIGNLTSQLFANAYLNEFDQFVKHELKVQHYIRYTDDFVVVLDDERALHNLLTPIAAFLKDKLALSLHPRKVQLRTFHQGIDFLGYILLPHHRGIRTKTKRRIFKKLEKRIEQCAAGVINKHVLEKSLQSYLGVLSHANTHKLRELLKNHYWFRLNG